MNDPTQTPVPSGQVIPIVSIVGHSGAGKTALIEKLIPELRKRGFRVATIKHHAHAGFEIDKRGKDTWRHAQAGSEQVILSAADKVAAIRYVDHPLTLNEIVARLIRDVDIILTDGFRRENKPKIEVLRAALNPELMCRPEELIAVATDVDLAPDLPQYDLDDAAGLTDLIVRLFLRR
jgi:molybdopterin-guanine dinucleotide biosynthesis protein B